MDLHNLTEHTLPAGSLVFMTGECGPDDVLAVRTYRPGDKAIYAEAMPEDEVAAFFANRDDTVLE